MRRKIDVISCALNLVIGTTALGDWPASNPITQKISIVLLITGCVCFTFRLLNYFFWENIAGNICYEHVDFISVPMFLPLKLYYALTL